MSAPKTASELGAHDGASVGRLDYHRLRLCGTTGTSAQFAAEHSAFSRQVRGPWETSWSEDAYLNAFVPAYLLELQPQTPCARLKMECWGRGGQTPNRCKS